MLCGFVLFSFLFLATFFFLLPSSFFLFFFLLPSFFFQMNFGIIWGVHYAPMFPTGSATKAAVYKYIQSRRPMWSSMLMIMFGFRGRAEVRVMFCLCISKSRQGSNAATRMVFSAGSSTKDAACNRLYSRVE